MSVLVHQLLNTSQGVIWNHDLICCSDDELQSELKDHQVIALRRLTKKQGDEGIPTGWIILTFALPSLPEHVAVGYLRLATRAYMPNLLCCFRCQKFWHVQLCCTYPTSCGMCNQPDYKPDKCALWRHIVWIAMVTLLPLASLRGNSRDLDVTAAEFSRCTQEVSRERWKW